MNATEEQLQAQYKVMQNKINKLEDKLFRIKLISNLHSNNALMKDIKNIIGE